MLSVAAQGSFASSLFGQVPEFKGGYVPRHSDVIGDSRYYPPTELEGLFFPRGNFFRRCGHESAPRVHFCAATPGSDKFHDCAPNFSLLYGGVFT